MTLNRAAPSPGGEIEVGSITCDCRNGNLSEAIAVQGKLVERAMARDPEAVAELYDRYVDDVYGYLLAWTRDPEVAEQLTERVFRDAVTWLPVVAKGEGELGAWLIAMARDAVAHGRGVARPADRDGAAGDVALLNDPEREVVILRLLLGHSLVHTAHLTGYRPRVTKALQLLACSTLWERSQESPGLRAARDTASEDGKATPEPYFLDPAQSDRRRADEFERRLSRWSADLTDDDRHMANALAIASSLRSAAAVVTPPDPGFVYRVREELVADATAEAVEDPVEVFKPSSRFRWRASGNGTGLLPGLVTGISRKVLLLALAGVVLAAGAGFVIYNTLAAPSSRCGTAGCLAPATSTGAGGPAVVAGTSPAPTTAGGPTTTKPGTSTTTAATQPRRQPPRTTSQGGAVRPPTSASPGTTRRPPTTTQPRPPPTPRPPTTPPPTTAPRTTAPPTTAPPTTTTTPPPA
jgi:hypothetical protein